MSDLPRRLLFEDDGAHVLEYSLLIIGLGTALFEPFLLTAAYYQVADLTRLLMSQLVTYF